MTTLSINRKQQRMLTSHSNHFVLRTQKKLFQWVLLLMTAFIIPAAGVFAQQKMVTGVVRDNNGAPLAGASITISGGSKGTTTDAEGKFSLSVPENGTIVISMSGHDSQTLSVRGRSAISVSLNQESAGLNEVVVVGYGTQRKKDLTGAVRKINIEESPISTITNVSPLQAIQGTPGVNIGPVATAGGAPSVLVRGQRSLAASNAPLIVLDGVIFGGSLNEINTQDIASFDILMDASAAAIYGSRAANGVIMVTTKRGKSGKPLITINNNYGFQSWTTRPDMRKGADFIKWRTDNRRLAGQSDLSVEKVLDPKEVIAYQAGQQIDWLEEITQFAPLNDLNVSVSGRSDKVNYYASAGYLKQNGVLDGDNFKKYTVTGKFDAKITSWLDYGLSVYYSARDYSGTPPDMGQATIGTPYAYKWKDEKLRILDKAPTPANLINPYWGDANNPGLYDDNLEKYTSTRIIGYLSADIPYIKGLNYRININKYKAEFFNGNFRHETHFINPDNPADIANPSRYLSSTYGSMSNLVTNSWEIQNLLTYKKMIGNHSFDGLAGYQRDYNTNSRIATSASDFSSAGTTVLGYYGLNLGNPANQRVSSTFNEVGNLAYLGRLNYNYDSKYYLTMNYRRDGYSAFAPGNKFADFYGGAVAYAISEENFFKKALPKVNYLKIRMAYGQNGNQGIDPYETLANIASGTTVFGSTSSLFIYQSSLSNKRLSWEKTTTLNGGLNFGFFNNRITGDLNIYKSKTTDQLLTRSLPFLTGFNSVRTNIGRVDNRGVEVSLTGVILAPTSPKGVRWEATVNYWMNRNKIVSLTGVDANGDGKEDDDIGNRWFIGKPIAAIYDYVVDGIVQASDIDYIAAFGAKPGDLKIRDINGTVRDDAKPDGKINSLDRTIVGYVQPRFSWSFANTLTYKNFQLYFNFNSVVGGGSENYYMAPNSTYNLTTFGNNQQQNWLNLQYWTPETPSNTFTRPNYSNPYGHTYPRERTFVRLQDLSLQYSLNKKQLEKLKMSGLRIYVSAKNPILFTNWLGMDPENGGQLGRANPLFRTINFGTNLNF
jgi:TonB-linked SusC/RagA family outer membrane protein